MSPLTLEDLPFEVQSKIFSHLSLNDLKATFHIKSWQPITNDELCRRICKEKPFTSEKWQHHFGVTVDQSVFELDIAKRLLQRCPIFPEKTIAETHVLVWIPKTINGAPFTINRLCELFQDVFPYVPVCYCFTWSAILACYGDILVEKSHWVLLSKNVERTSIKKTIEEQRELVSKIAQRTGISYEIPNVIDLVTSIFVNSYSTNEEFFSQDVYTVTRCQEYVEEHPVIVGGIRKTKIELRYFTPGIVDTGVLLQARLMGIADVDMGDRAMARVAMDTL